MALPFNDGESTLRQDLTLYLRHRRLTNPSGSPQRIYADRLLRKLARVEYGGAQGLIDALVEATGSFDEPGFTHGPALAAECLAIEAVIDFRTFGGTRHRCP